MSSRKVKQITRTLQCSNVVKSGTGPYTHTCTTGTHNILSGDVLLLVNFGNYPQQLRDVTTTTGTTGTTVVFTTAEDITINTNAFFYLNYYSTGQTGAQDSFTLPITEGSRALLQSYVVGTGGATYTLEGSLDGNFWSTLSTISHTTSTNDSAFQSLSDPWSYYRINISVIGASTKLYLLGAV